MREWFVMLSRLMRTIYFRADCLERQRFHSVAILGAGM